MDETKQECQEQFRAIRSLLKEQEEGGVGKKEYGKCMAICDEVLQRVPGHVHALRVKVSCLVALDQIEEAIKECGNREELLFERAYCLYRLNKLDEVIELCSSINEPRPEKVVNLEAQTYYRLQKYDKAVERYANIASSSDPSELEADMLSNIYAAYTSAGRGQEVLDEYPVDDDIVGDSFELLFNTVCALISAGQVRKAVSTLDKTELLCRDVLTEEGASDEEIRKELTSIQLQKLFVGIILNKSNSAASTQTYTNECLAILRQSGELKRKNHEALAVAANNLAVLRGDKDLPDSLRRLRTTITKECEDKLSLKQLMEIRYNRCILLLRMRKLDDAVRSLEELDRIYGASTKQGILLKASIAVISGNFDKADSILLPEMKRLRTIGNTDDALDEVSILYIQTLIMRLRYDEAFDILKDITSLKFSPAGVSASFYIKSLSHHQANPDLSFRDCLDKISLEYLVKVAEEINDCSDTVYSAAGATQTLLFISQILEQRNHHSASANVLQILLRCGGDDLSGVDRLRITAHLVSAMSYDNPEEASRYANSLPQINHDDVDAIELERKGILRIKKQSGATNAKINQDDEKEKALETRRLKKIQKRRANRKAQYLKKLEEEGKYDPSRPTKPDGERWIAVKQRSYNKRGRKNRSKFVGGQGSGDGAQKDMLKLDAMARSQMEKPVAIGTVKSSGNNKKKKGKGKKK